MTARGVPMGLKLVSVVCLVAFAVLSLIGIGRGFVACAERLHSSLKEWWKGFLWERSLNLGLQKWVDQSPTMEERRKRKETAAHIRSCILYRTSYLSLRHEHEDFPVEILRRAFPYLTTLSITAKKLPEWLLEAEVLIDLGCELQEEEELPDRLRPVLERLRSLTISAPKLKRLPEWFVTSEELYSLIIENSKIEQFVISPGIFPALRKLIISSSNMKKFLMGSGGAQLGSLSIKGASLEQFEFQKGAVFPELAYFEISESQLERLELSPQVVPRLRKLFLDGNRLKEIPRGLETFPKLVRISMMRNLLTHPIDLFSIRRDYRAWVRGNPLESRFLQAVQGHAWHRRCISYEERAEPLFF